MNKAKYLLAYVTSDLHLHFWEHYNKDGDRTKAAIQFLRDLFQRASEMHVPILFGGDIFHTPEGLKSPTINAVYPEIISIFNEYSDVNFYAISGNHDQYTKNYMHSRSISYTAGLANTIKNFHLLDFGGTMLTPNVGVYGIPYIYLNHNYAEALAKATRFFTEYKAKKTILLIHTTIEGSVDTNGYSVTETALLMEELEKRFTLVLSGHIHKFQKMRRGIYHIGSPVHVKTSDEGYNPVFLKVFETAKALRVKTIDVPNAKVFKSYTDPSQKTDDPNIMWVFKSNPSDEEVITTHADLMDFEELMRGFLKALGVKSPKRKNIAMAILKEVSND